MPLVSLSHSKQAAQDEARALLTVRQFEITFAVEELALIGSLCVCPSPSPYASCLLSAASLLHLPCHFNSAFNSEKRATV